MYKKILRILSLALALLLLTCVLPTPQTSAAHTQEDRILQQIPELYSTALKRSNRYSFHGACGAYVNWHLHLLGINTGFYSALRRQRRPLLRLQEPGAHLPWSDCSVGQAHGTEGGRSHPGG